jgi:hypothetical protein
MKRVIALIGISLFLAMPVPAYGDDPNPSTSTIDNYASLNGSSSSKQGFQSATQSNYLGGVNNFTVESWLNPGDTATSSLMQILAKTDMLQYQISSGIYEFIFNSGGWKTAQSTGVKARINEWQHVAFVKNGNTLSFYFNGNLAYQLTDATNIPTSLTNTSSYLSIGSNPWNGSTNQSTPFGNLFSGGIDEVRVWSTARTQSEIQTWMNEKIASSSTGLLSYWDFNGTSSSTTLHDRSINALNLTINGTPKPTFPDIKTTTISGGYQTVTFTRTYLNASASYVIPAGVTRISALVVGGGGGGGFDGGGGGGGGAVYQYSTLSVTPGGSMAVVVGGGGFGAKGYVGGTFCNGTWSGTAVGCSGGQGSSSQLGGTLASGGGGGGGIEANGSADSYNFATVRGGGGGAGGQNSSSGAPTPGVGSYTGGTVSNVDSYGGGGGASSVANGGNVTSTTAGNGAAGVTSTITGLVYGSGGAGGSFSSSTVATGGTGAANGGSFSAAPTTALANRGGGGGGGGRGDVAGNANGSHGAAGIVIIRFALTTSGTLSLASTPVYNAANTITITTSAESKVTFLANGKRIPGCASKNTTSLTATCSWKPTIHGFVTLSAQIVPIDNNYPTSTSLLSARHVAKRTGLR